MSNVDNWKYNWKHKRVQRHKRKMPKKDPYLHKCPTCGAQMVTKPKKTGFIGKYDSCPKCGTVAI